MLTLTYEIGCRNCFQSDGLRRVLSLYDEREEEFKFHCSGRTNGILKHPSPVRTTGEAVNHWCNSEYDVMKYLEGITEESCSNCNSTNIAIRNIELNGKALYDPKELQQMCDETGIWLFGFKVQKDVNGLKINRAGSVLLNEDFLISAIDKISETIKKRPMSNYKQLEKGFCFIIVSGSFNKVTVERFDTVGLTRDEIHQAFDKLADNWG